MTQDYLVDDLVVQQHFDFLHAELLVLELDRRDLHRVVEQNQNLVLAVLVGLVVIMLALALLRKLEEGEGDDLPEEDGAEGGVVDFEVLEGELLVVFPRGEQVDGDEHSEREGLQALDGRTHQEVGEALERYDLLVVDVKESWPGSEVYHKMAWRVLWV